MDIEDDYNVLIISFDGVPMSGIVVESIKLIGFLKNNKKRIFMETRTGVSEEKKALWQKKMLLKWRYLPASR
ncbi:hypothetical protein J8V57_05165 [Xenorhabdus sp. PB61.4]|uniref:hypothetical protein n=1 Tax=Xenorhabdus sp. PB61.4 TaxID=2788940 RepID=UPI001E5F32F9|nr:hypothetical protein [Xenorhabdus sp. PB61.4]MCC8365670.1 hypothetical protein [Xenorhabdus sp. PB61.4]